MHIHDVGVPLMVCMHLTYPERVQAYNWHRLSEAVRNGPRGYPGARYVIFQDGSEVDLDSDKRHELRLTYGMVVRRHLVEGDYVLMNRQPTLHRWSMMAHRVHVIHTPRDAKSFQVRRLHGRVGPPRSRSISLQIHLAVTGKSACGSCTWP